MIRRRRGQGGRVAGGESALSSGVNEKVMAENTGKKISLALGRKTACLQKNVK